MEYCDNDKIIEREQYYLDSRKRRLRFLTEAGTCTFKGYKHTEEHKALLSQVRTGEGNPMYGKKGPLSPRWETKLPANQVLKMKEDFGKRVWLYDISTKKIIDIFISIHAVADFLKSDRRTINNYCKNQHVFRNQYILSFSELSINNINSIISKEPKSIDSPRYKKVYVYEGISLIYTYNSISEMMKIYNCSNKYINKCVTTGKLFRDKWTISFEPLIF